MKAPSPFPLEQHDAALWEALDSLRDSAPVTEARDYVDALGRRRSKWQALREWLWPRAFAAGVCAVAAVTLFALLLPSAPSSQDVIRSLVGERKQIALADGSHVTLDTDSEVSVRMMAGERRLALLRGRASFAVAHDPKRPFRVTSGTMTVTAIGTDFDVSAVGGRHSVTLVHGRVSVEAPAPAGQADHQRVFLSPGQQLAMAPDGALGRPSAIDLASVTAWREGRLDFSHMRVSDAIAEVNRYSTRKIRLLDAQSGSRTLEGSFRAGQTNAFAKALCAFLDLRIVGQSDSEILLDRRN